MAEAAYTSSPALLRALRLPSSIFSEFFVPCFSAGPKQCASAGPQRAQVPHNLTSEPPKSGAPNGVFCSQFQRGAQRAQGPQKTSDLKI
jgi:hypothetical protein